MYTILVNSIKKATRNDANEQSVVDGKADKNIILYLENSSDLESDLWKVLRFRYHERFQNKGILSFAIKLLKDFGPGLLNMLRNSKQNQ